MKIVGFKSLQLRLVVRLAALYVVATAIAAGVLIYQAYDTATSLSDQELLLEMGYSDNRYAREHYETIARFGRFPHRNRALGRKNTAEEDTYLSRRETGQ